MSSLRRIFLAAGFCAALALAKRPPRIEDLYRIVEVSETAISPDGKWIAYVVQSNANPRKVQSHIFLAPAAGGAPKDITRDDANESQINWRRDSSAFAFSSEREGRSEICMARPDGTREMLVTADNTNHVLPSTGKRFDWSPDGRQLVYVAADPKDPNESTDPVHITRYLYKFISGEDDNRHIHLHVYDLAARRSRQLTKGLYYEHSVEWSPDGREILFESNRGPLDELEFNYDIFAADAASGRERRITDTKSQEYHATWSPDGKWIAYLGTKRDITCSETTMEDTHVWVVPAAGGKGRETAGSATLDRRAMRVSWAADGKHLYFLAQDRGNVRLYSVPAEGSGPAKQLTERKGTIGDYSLSREGSLAYSYRSPAAPAELFLDQKQVTKLNDDLMNEIETSMPEELNYTGLDGTPVQAWLTPALDRQGGRKYPLVLVIHGGPHGQQGPAFSIRNQAYAAAGYSTLMVNYRGSTGYGEKFSEGTFNNNDGTEWDDVNAGVDFAIAQKNYVDADRLGIEGTSYGGQLTNWGITRTTRFKAAIPTAGISNFVSYNFNSYYHDYYRVEYGKYPWEGELYKVLWEHSPLAYVTRVKTPCPVHSRRARQRRPGERFRAVLHRAA